MSDIATPALRHLRTCSEPLSAAEIARDLGWPRWRGRNAIQSLRRYGAIVADLRGNGGNVPTRWRPRT